MEFVFGYTQVFIEQNKQPPLLCAHLFTPQAINMHMGIWIYAGIKNLRSGKRSMCDDARVNEFSLYVEQGANYPHHLFLN